MCYEYTVKIPEQKGKVYRRKASNGTIYIEYEFERTYDPKKKYNTPKRTSIGKQCEDDPERMHPNSNFYKFFPEGEGAPEEKTDRSACLHVGAFAVIEKIVREYKLDRTLEDIIGKDSGLFLDLAAYSIICEDNAAQYYPDYAFNHPLFTEGMRVYSDSKISRFLRNISYDQGASFLNSWNKDRNKREKIYISYDSTNKTCQAGDIELAEIGNPKDHGDKAVVNYAIAYDTNNREPLFYEDYPGSVVDVAQLECMISTAEGYGYRNVGFILDRGYFSKKNIQLMDEKGYGFVIMVKGMKKLVSSLILEKKGTFEDKRQNAIPQYHVDGITVRHKMYGGDEKERYFHIYYSSSAHAAEKRKLEDKLEKMKKMLKKMEGKRYRLSDTYLEYFDPIYYHEGEEDEKYLCSVEKTDNIDREISLAGYFAIVTSEEMDARDALYIYKSRDASEKLFRGDKSYLGNKAERVHEDEAEEAKILIEFVALIIRNKIYTCLQEEVGKDGSKANYMTVPAALKELEKIEIVKRLDNRYRMPYAVTATQKAILNAFGMTAENVKRCAEVLDARLRK